MWKHYIPGYRISTTSVYRCVVCGKVRSESDEFLTPYHNLNRIDEDHPRYLLCKKCAAVQDICLFQVEQIKKAIATRQYVVRKLQDAYIIAVIIGFGTYLMTFLPMFGVVK